MFRQTIHFSPCVALLSVKAKFTALTTATKKIILIKNLLINFDWNYIEAVKIFEDNQ